MFSKKKDKKIRLRLLDTIGILIISAAMLFAATSAMSMDTRTMLTMFWGDSYTSTLEMADTLEMLDTLEMN